MTPDLAIVVLTYNARAHIDVCLQAATAQSVPARVIVADNGSADDTVAHVRAAWPAVDVLEFGANLGFAGGYNRALAAVDAEWLVLLNADAVLAPEWCESLLDFSAAHPQALVLGGALLFWRDGAPSDVVQSLGSRFTDAGSAFEVGWGMPRAEVPADWLTPHATAAIPGAALLIRRKTFWDLGGFDPGYFAYLEDVDLCWRAWLAGGEVWVVPTAQCWHAYGATAGGRVSPLRVRLMQRNRYANMVRLLQAPTLAAGLLTSIGYDGYRMLEYVAHGRWEGLRALAAGSLEAVKSLPRWWRARQGIQARRRRTDRELRAAGFLVSALAGMREYRRLATLRAGPNAGD
jgi:GT2 family glycosyltransferase